MSRFSKGLLSLWVFAIVCPCTAQIMSIDLGHEFFKVALMRQGAPLEIVLNPHSKRKTATAVSFLEAIRTFGDDALPHAGKAPTKVPVFFHSLLAHNFTDMDVKPDGRWWKEFALGNRFYSYDLGWDAERGVPTFMFGLETEYSMEVVLANVLYFAKTLSEVSADGKPVKDAVVTMPSSANMRYRQAIVAAGEIAGLRITSLVHEGPAAAVHRAIDYQPEKGKVEKQLVYNMGSRKTEVTVLQLESRQAGMVAGKTAPVVTVLGSALDMGIGGHLMDLKIADAMLIKFQEKFKNLASGIAGNSRALRKLVGQAQKTKATLSANKQAPFIVESLFEDTDFQTTIKREEFETMCSEMFGRLTDPIEVALGFANTTLADIDHIELIGGAWRVPKVQQILSEYVEEKAGKKIPLGQHLNGEEAAAQGAVLVGANGSSSFRVKKIFFTDVTTHEYSVQVVSTSGEWEKNLTTLFPVGAPLGGKKKLSFSLEEDFIIKLFEDGVLLSEYTVSGLVDVLSSKWKDYNMTGTPKVTVAVHLENSGIIDIKKPEATCEESYFVNETKKLPKKNSTKGNKTLDANTTAESPDAESESDEKGDTDKKEASPDSEESAVKEETDIVAEDDSNTTNSSDEEEIVWVLKKKKHEKKLTLARMDYRPIPMTKDQIKESKKMLDEMASKEAEVQAVKEMSNELESSIYAARDKLESESIIQVSAEEQREAVTKLCSEIEEWTYEGSTEKHEYEKRLESLRGLLGPMEERAQELEDRADLGDTVKDAMEAVEGSRNMIKKDMPWVNETKVLSVDEKTNEFQTWWTGRQEKQKELPLHEAPAYTKTEVLEKLEQLTKEWDKLKKIKKPKESKKQKKDDEKDAKKDADSTEESALPNDVAATETEIEEIKKKKEKAVENEDFDMAQQLKKRQDALKKHLSKLKEEL